ncbi:helix-hairpin-helix domain-containing protein [Desulfomicrobium baculatum]|uniref:Putative mitomycin resistance protein n=1 Tax=Desulfomicrobium baculatum (strain DSM 4028 / VKM B-1378 / X) TaxID=525897 RepID=C7LTB2_DESBD|nr:helix-hairpin-helix domain-containing protein [Desulfomicrobium baculatum]ACU89469.1 putative mitomycin resistance protein [Desulfomicrobium baculatum DSM 4028]
MNPAKVRRDRLLALTDLPNIGPAMARDLQLLGFEHPGQLAGQNPQALYDRLSALTGVRQDPCVLDVFVSVTRFMDGEEARPWWHYTPERK